MILQGGLRGSGWLELIGSSNRLLVIQGPTDYTGSLHVTDNANVWFDGADKFPGTLEWISGEVRIQKSVEMDSLVLPQSGRLIGEGDAVLTIADHVQLDGGIVDVNLIAPHPLEFRAPLQTEHKRLGDQYTDPVHIHRGRVLVSDALGLGSPDAGTRLEDPSRAVLILNNGVTLDEPIDLNNSHDRMGSVRFATPATR